MVYTERAEMAADLSGTSHVRTKQRCNYTKDRKYIFIIFDYTTWVDIQSAL